MIKIADVNMDNINVEIQSSSEKASQGINSLIETLNNLNSALSGVQNNVNKYLINMNKIANTSKKMNLPTNSFSFTAKNNNAKEMSYLNSGKTDNNSAGQAQKTAKSIENSKNATKGLKVNLGELGQTVSKISGRIREMLKNLAKTGIATAAIKTLNNGFSSLRKGVSSAGDRIRSLTKTLAIYAAGVFGIRSAFYAIKNSTNEFLSSQNALAQQLNANISYLKYAIGASLAPVITFLTNLVYSLLKAIQYLVYYFAKINIFANASAKSMGSAAGSAKKTTKELQKQLQAFDELNNINFNTGSNGGSGAGGAVAPDLDLTKVDESFKYLFDDIDNWGKNLAEKINNFLYGIKWEPILEGAEKVATKLAKILNDFTYYLDFKEVGYSIAQGINTALIFIDTFFQKYQWSMLGEQLGNGLNSMVQTIQWDTLGRTLTDGMRATILTLEGFVTTFKWSSLGKRVGEMLMSAFNNIPWENLANAINVGVVGFFDSFIAFLDTVEWDKIGKTIGKFLNDINWGEILKKLFITIGKIGKGLAEVMWNGIFSGSSTTILASLVGGFLLLKGAIGGLTSIVGVTSQFGNFVQVAGGIKKVLPAIQTVAKSLGAITLVVSGVALAVSNFISMWQNGVTNLKAALMTLGVVVAAIGAVLLGVSAPVAAIVAGVVLLVGSIALLTKEFVTNKAEIKSVKKAQEDYNKAVEDAAEKQKTYEDAIDRATDTMKSLEEIERETGLSGEALYNQVENGTLTYANMTQQQREVYKAYKDNKTAQEEAEEATRAYNEAKKEELKQSFENQLALAKESGNYDDFKKSVVDAFEKGQISADEARDLIERSMASMKTSSHETFVEDIPSDITNGLDPNKYASGARKFVEWFKNIWRGLNIIDEWLQSKVKPYFTLQKWIEIVTPAAVAIKNKFNEIKTKFSPIRDWWNTHIAPWFTAAKWRSLAQKGVDGIKSAFSNLNIRIKMPHFSWSSQPASGWIAKTLSALNLPTSLPKLSVSWYAEGGFPTEGDLFFANEAGPEMVGSIGNKNAVANNDQITRAIAQATYEAISQALSEQENDGQPLVVNIGNETLYKGIVRSRSQASNQYGVTL